MDESAVVHASDDVLRNLGIQTDGNLIRLRIWCKNNSDSQSQRKADLKSIVENGGRLAPTTKGKEKSKIKEKQELKKKTVYVTWENFDKKKNRYALVKASRGGGCRKMCFDANLSREELLQTSAVSAFFCQRCDVINPQLKTSK